MSCKSYPQVVRVLAGRESYPQGAGEQVAGKSYPQVSRGAKVIHRLGEQVGAAKVIHRSRACGGQVGGVQVRGVWAGNLKLFSQTP